MTQRSARERPALGAERAEPGEEALRELVESIHRVEVDAGVEALGENNPVGERRTEPGRHREAVLGVEAVLVAAAKSHRWSPFSGRAR